MSDKNTENMSERGKENVAKETREAIRPVVKQLTEKLGKMGFDKKDFIPAIKKGLEDSKNDI